MNQQSPIVQKPAERQALASGFYITRRRLFLEEKGFDELFYNAWEGLEYSLKIYNKGYKCMYFPDAKAYHVKGSGRNRRFRDESYQTGYFWHQWGGKIKMDIPDLYRMQLQKDDYQYRYLLINGSSIRDNIWSILLKEFSFHIIGQYNIEKSMIKNTISLEDSVPGSFLQCNTSILFVVDNFRDIINNYRVFAFRSSFMPHDMVLDLHGNVIHLYNYLKEK